jgi:uncharacterized protein YjiS (DUF1127 family)
MAYFNHNQSSGQLSLGKFSGMFFTRQTRFMDAKTHPGIFSAFLKRINAWRVERAAANELSGLSDRELADIGLTRLDIPTVVRIRR